MQRDYQILTSSSVRTFPTDFEQVHDFFLCIITACNCQYVQDLPDKFDLVINCHTHASTYVDISRFYFQQRLNFI